MNESIFTKKLIAGSKTYFFDIRKIQSGDKYLQITELRLKKDGEELRNSIVIFGDHIKEFSQLLDEISKKI